MKNEQIEPFSNPDEPNAGHGAKPGWLRGVTELLDHLAQELALEYVQLMEQAALQGYATPRKSSQEEE